MPFAGTSVVAAGAAADVAGLHVLDVHVLLAAEGGLLQGEGQAGPDGTPLGRAGAGGAAAPTKAPKAAAAEEGPEEVPHVKAAEPAKPAAGTAGAEVGIHPGETELVVLGPLILIGKDLIGLVDLLEAGLGGFVPGVEVRVVLLGQLPVCLFQFLVRGVLLHAQDLVVISFILCHRFLTSL